MTNPSPAVTASPNGLPVAPANVPSPHMPEKRKLSRPPTGLRRLLVAVILVAAGFGGYVLWKSLQPAKLPEGFAGSNGRIEATEVDIATKMAGRLKDVLVNEGDFVTAGQVLAQMDTDVLTAQLREAEADLRRAFKAVETAQSGVDQRESEKEAAEAVVLQRDAELDRAKKRLARTEQARRTSAVSEDDVDNDRAAFHAAQAAVKSSKASVASSAAAISTAKALHQNNLSIWTCYFRGWIS